MTDDSKQDAASFPTMEGGAAPGPHLAWMNANVPWIHDVVSNYLILFQMHTIKQMYHEAFVIGMNAQCANMFESGKFIFAPNNHTMLLLVNCKRGVFEEFLKYMKEAVRIWGGDLSTVKYTLTGDVRET